MADDEMLTMAPARWPATMARAAAWAQRKPPLRFTPSTWSHSRSLSSRNSERGNTPAVLTRMSGVPGPPTPAPGRARGGMVEEGRPAVAPPAGQRQREGPADTLLRARDERHLARESHSIPPRSFVRRALIIGGLKATHRRK